MSSCVVPGCKSGHKANQIKSYLFGVPKDNELRKQWQVAVRRRELKVGERICAKHFRTEEVIFKRILRDQNGKELGVSPLKIPKLVSNVIPSLFWWNTMYEKLGLSQSHDNKNNNGNKEFEKVDISGVDKTPQFEAPSSVPIEFENNDPNKHSLTFVNLLSDEYYKIPPSWQKTLYDVSNERFLIYSYVHYITNEGTIVDKFTKKVVINEKLKIEFKVNDILIDLSWICNENIDTIEMLTKAIENFSNKLVCDGARLDAELLQINRKLCSYTDKFNIIRHLKCTLLADKEQCDKCRSVKKILKRKKKRNTPTSTASKNSIKKNHLDFIDYKEKYDKLKISHSKMKKKQDQLLDINNKLKATLAETHNAMTSMDENIIDAILKNNDKNISDEQKNVIKDIFNTSKCNNSNGRRYSDNWIYMCVLLHMKSPTTYRFIRENNILPLPCPSTIKKHLSAVTVSCGFDNKFFQLFGNYIKKNGNKDGILLVDEIGLRESIAVDVKNLEFIGYEDYGKESSTDNTDEKANHGLVFMFQSLTDSFTQPVAVFASHGSTSGIVLAKLIINAIILLEKSGAKIWGVITDGATPNRKFWSEVGVSGRMDELKSHFQHPTDEDRKIYVFSDTPHLIKTIRNRLHDKKTLKMDPLKPSIKWEHFELIYKEDKTKPGYERIIPKITENHSILNNSSKMRVRLAVQIFSNSMVRGLATYRKKFENEDFNETVEFCSWINELFDCLNENHKEIQPDDRQYKLIEEALSVLNKWEKYWRSAAIKKDEFLTTNTAEGLRVTLQSILDLIKDFKAVNNGGILTGRVNQDSLERFFGSVRQAAGTNDHPATPTFLQIYRILSLHSVLKPPKSGNCQIKTANQLITLEDLKLIYNNNNNHDDRKIEKIREMIKNAVSNDDWQVENTLSEHDYYAAEITDCIIYYSTGEISSKILKNLKCKTCHDSICNPEPTSFLPESRISTNQAANGNFLHPNTGFYNLISKINRTFENFFQNKSLKAFIWEDVVNELVDNEELSFPCKIHRVDILTSIIYNYIRIRMNKIARGTNSSKFKDFQEKRKISKFCKN